VGNIYENGAGVKIFGWRVTLSPVSLSLRLVVNAQRRSGPSWLRGQRSNIYPCSVGT
jgi:hypothetical protein